MSEHSNPESCVTWYFRDASEEDECHCAEVLAEMGTEAVIEWLEDKGYVIRHEDIIGDYLEGGE
jgi:hypothetical protein